MPDSQQDRPTSADGQRRRQEAQQRRRDESTAYRQRCKERVSRLVLAANMPAAMRQANTLTLLGRLKLTFTQTWAECVTRHAKRADQIGEDSRANIRENNRVNRVRTQAFLAEVEAQLVKEGRLVPEDVLGSTRS